MNEEKKRKIIIVGSLILFILLIVIVILILKRGSGKNTQPVGLSCSKSGQTATITWRNKSSDQGVLVYGTQASAQMPFLSEEASAPAPVDAGLYEHTVKLDALGSDTYIVAVSGFTGITAECKGVDPEPKSKGPSLNSTNAAVQPTQVVQIQEEPTPEPTDVITPTPIQSGGTSTLLPIVNATSYFNDNPSKSIYDCVRNFRYETSAAGKFYTGLASICASAWTQVNLSK